MYSVGYTFVIKTNYKFLSNVQCTVYSINLNLHVFVRVKLYNTDMYRLINKHSDNTGCHYANHQINTFINKI